MKAPARSHGAQTERARYSGISRRVLLPAQQFLHDETVAGLVLLSAAILAMVWANSPWANAYAQVFQFPISIHFGDIVTSQNLRQWINDGLMAIFFFLVALEIKRELLHGELSDARKAALPVVAAFGGMALPAGIFLIFNSGGGGARGWAIPMATDIAFAVGVLALLGRRVPAQLRLFLLTYAVVDDLGSILVIAVYYMQHFTMMALVVAAGCIAVLGLMRWLGFWSPAVYVVPAFILWAAMLKSGVHATISGVILGAMTPAAARADSNSVWAKLQELFRGLRNQKRAFEKTQAALGEAEEVLRHSESPLERVERMVRPWVNFFVLPVFALANAGVIISAELLKNAVSSPLTQGIIGGLLIGKPIGTIGAAWIATRLGWAALPQNVRWRQMIGAGIIGGIGFTVSLFISNLAFGGKDSVDEAKIGILAASCIAATAGYLFLRFQPGSGTARPTTKSQRNNTRLSHRASP